MVTTIFGLCFSAERKLGRLQSLHTRSTVLLLSSMVGGAVSYNSHQSQAQNFSFPGDGPKDPTAGDTETVHKKSFSSVQYVLAPLNIFLSPTRSLQ